MNVVLTGLMEAFFRGGAHDVGDLRSQRTQTAHAGRGPGLQAGAWRLAYRPGVGRLARPRSGGGLRLPYAAQSAGDRQRARAPSDYGTGLGQVAGSRG